MSRPSVRGASLAHSEQLASSQRDGLQSHIRRSRRRACAGVWLHRRLGGQRLPALLGRPPRQSSRRLRFAVVLVVVKATSSWTVCDWRRPYPQEGTLPSAPRRRPQRPTYTVEHAPPRSPVTRPLRTRAKATVKRTSKVGHRGRGASPGGAARFSRLHFWDSRTAGRSGRTSVVATTAPGDRARARRRRCRG